MNKAFYLYVETIGLTGHTVSSNMEFKGGYYHFESSDDADYWLRKLEKSTTVAIQAHEINKIQYLNGIRNERDKENSNG